MKGRFIIKIWVSMALTILTLLNFQSAYAFAPYHGYIYDPNGKSLPSLNGYEPEKLIMSHDIGISDMKNPKDFFVSESLRRIYILDSGNGRIIILNDRYALEKTITSFTHQGQETALNNPSSIFVTEAGEIYVADTANHRVLKMGDDGRIEKIIGKPETEMYPSNVAFEPLKVLVDESDNIYILIKGLYQGALVLTGNGEFNRFYASAKVMPTIEVLTSRFWRLFMTQEQKAAQPDYVPTEFSSFDIDSEGFIYTVTQDKSTQTVLKKFNMLGNGIVMNNVAFGDLESQYDKELIVTQFIDVNVEENFFVDALDLTRGRIFRYDQDFNLLFIFGGPGGAQLGTFKTPVAVDNLGENILVLDSDLSSITVFSPTEFGKKVNRAIALYNSGGYLEAIEPWKEIVSLNENYSLAYKGIGDGLFMTGQYKAAMDNYRLASDKTSYLRAFREYRNIVIRKYFPAFIAVVVLILIFTALGKTLYTARGRKR